MIYDQSRFSQDCLFPSLKKKKKKEKREEKIGSLHTLTILFQWTDIQTRFFSPLSSDQVIILQSGTFDKTVPHNYQANPSPSFVA